MTFQIKFSQFYDYSEPKQWKWNKISHFSMAHIQIWHHIFLSKDIKAFPWLSKSKFVSIMTKVSPNNGNEAKSDTFSWGISSLTPCLFYLYWLQWTQRMEMEQNQTYFHGTYSNLTSFLIGHKILKYFNRFYSWHLFIWLQNWAQPSKVKWN